MLAHATQGQFVAVGGQARAEEGPLSMRAALMYSATGVRRAEMYLFGLGARALELEAQRRLVAVLVDVRDVEPAAGFDARAGVEIELEDGAVTQFQQRVAGQHRHQLPRPCFREGAGFIDRIEGFARDELRMGGIRYKWSLCIKSP